MEVTLLYFDGCPSCQTADQRLRAVAADVGFTINRVEVETVFGERRSRRSGP